MKFIYATDLHGDTDKYETLFKKAVDNDIKLIHMGADILPKGSGIFSIQKKFVNGYLRRFYEKCGERGIKILASFGNDDIYTRKKYFRKYGQLLDESPVNIEGYRFIAYNYVPDYKFGLKTACKHDFDGWKLKEFYIHDPVDVGPEGFVTIEDPVQYFSEKGTIEKDLANLKGGQDTIAAIHCPPWKMDLDVCGRRFFSNTGEPLFISGNRVGSKAVFDWIKREQPRLVLCGHIHENFRVTQKWKDYLGKTLVIQPGQSLRNSTVFVEITIESDRTEVERYDIGA